jgi:Flp pilus assembly protein TadB
MPCARCGADVERGWCTDCEALYDTWARRHAADIVWQVLAGMVVVLGCAVGVPVLGGPWLVGASGAVAGFATILGLSRWNRRRRRRQFLDAPLPRAYLAEPK